MIVTIDGPTASGKSTVARMVAQELGFYYLPTGWFYRAVAYVLVNNCGYTKDMLENPSHKDITVCVDPTKLHYTYDEGMGGKMFYDGKDITPFLKDAQVDSYVAIISPVADIRKLVTQAQRNFAASHDAVIEGRDIGSVVFPCADHKFYLTASLAVRGARWQADQKNRGNNFTLQEAQDQISYRDARDKNREISPLIVPEGSVTIDNSKMDLNETIQEIMKYIEQ
jgi:cytidylate kinase